MEFNEKLAELRQKKGLTQEELASLLFVSRTAVSKWESGRGYPNIESLKEIAKFFSVTVDELLSGDELISIAEEDKGKVKKHYKRLLFGLSDIIAALLFVLPLFGDRSNGEIISTQLLLLSSASLYLKILYVVLLISVVVLGILIISVQKEILFKISVMLSVIGVLLFTVSLQPYAAVFLFTLLILKMTATRKISRP